MKKLSVNIILLKYINDATAKTIFFRRQAEKSLVFLQKNLQKPTFCRIAINFKNTIHKISLFYFYMIAKRVFILLTYSVIFSNCLGGIADKGGMVRNFGITPNATNLQAETFKILGRSEGESSTFFYFGLIPLTNPLNIEYALSQAVQKIPGGDTIINIKIWHETHYYFPLGTVSVVKVQGDVVSLKPVQESLPVIAPGGKK